MTDRSVYGSFIHMPATTQFETKKEALLEVAADLFYEQGFNCTGIKQIIEAAGIAKGTFYSHYKSKADIGTAWLVQRHTYWNGLLFDFLSNQDPSPRGQLLGIFDFLNDWMKSCDNRGCAFLNSLSEIPDSEHSMREVVRLHHRELRESVRQLVVAHFTTKSAKECQHITDNLFVAIVGAITATQSMRDSWPIDTARAQLESIL